MNKPRPHHGAFLIPAHHYWRYLVSLLPRLETAERLALAGQQ